MDMEKSTYTKELEKIVLRISGVNEANQEFKMQSNI
jgi:hypothetical protein